MKINISKNVRPNAKMKKRSALKIAEKNSVIIKIKNGFVKRNAQIKKNNVKKSVNKIHKAYL